MKVLVGTLLLSALVTTPALAGDKSLLLSIAAAHSFDILSTHIALRSSNTAESNPLMRHPAGLIGLKAGVATAQAVVIQRMYRSGHKRAALITAIGMVSAYTFIGVHNLRVAR